MNPLTLIWQQSRFVFLLKTTFALTFLATFLSWTVLAQAENMSSDSFQIQFGNFNVTSGQKSSSSYSLTDTVGQIAPGEFTGTGYVVKSGFQYIYPFKTFSFKISKLTVHLGDLTYGSFNTDSHTLIVDTDGAGGYAVRAFETHPLRKQNGTTIIPDTTCDAGTCSETTAQVWVNPTNPGFGFNMTGDDIANDFTDSTYFRQFANQAGAESMQTIMSASTLSTNRNATVTYKVAPQGNQEAGNYETLVVFTAIPTY